MSSNEQARRRRRLAGAFLAVGVAALMAACGGSGGGDAAGGGSSGGGTPPPPPAPADPVATALSTGNAEGVSREQVSAALQSFFVSQRAAYAELKQAVFGLNADGSANAGSVGSIDWDPTRAAIYLTNLDSARNVVVLPNNWDYLKGVASPDAQPLAIFGSDSATSARHAVFGGHPLAVPGNAAMDQFMTRVVGWLTRRNDFTGLKVVVAHQPSSAEATTRSWLAAKYPGLTLNGISTNPASQSDNRCDNAKLDACLQGADLLVIGHDQGSGYDGTAVMQAVAAAQGRGTAVLYLHSSWSTPDLTSRLLASFRIASADDYAGNYFAGYGLKSFAPASLTSAPGNLGAIQSMIDRLDQGSFTTTWSGCVTSTGKTDCSDDTAYQSEYGNAADAIRSTLRQLDANSTAIFGAEGYTLEKLLVLLADKYRTEVAYSSSFTKESNKTAFLRATFSDAGSYMTRGYSSVAQNLGNFSGLFAAGTPTLTRTVTVALPSTGTKDHATGLYVLPGRSVTLTRTDSGTGVARFGVNMLRNTTRPFNRLDRPTQLASARPLLVPHVPVTITNPYGGPLYLFVDAADGQPDVALQVSGVITHPVLRNAGDPVQVAAFIDEVDKTSTNWVVIASDTLTLHSTLPNFRTSINNTASGAINYGGDVSKMLADTWTYAIQNTYELAGFNSSSGQLRLATPVVDFCNNKGWDCTGTQHRRDEMQHVISDVLAYCGAGCSGNPYDQNWAFEPLGWGETHEVGHNLQRSRLNIYGGISGEVSNNIFPTHKHITYNLAAGSMVFKDRGTIGSEQALCTNHSQSVGACVFSIMKAAQAQADARTPVYNAIWSDPAYAVNNSERVMFYRQLTEYARYYRSSFQDGWELYTLLYLLERNFSASSGNWASVRAGFGFGTYASHPADMDGNDFMLVASSFIIGRDMRPVFDLWGITYSTAASDQVNAYGYAAAGKLFFPMASLSAQGSGVGAPVTVTSTASYPAGY